MTVKVSVSIPDDVAEWLAGQRNTSAAVAAAVRAQMDNAQARSSKRCRDAQVYATWAAEHGYDSVDETTNQSNELALGDQGW
jgi:hypothetical protein